MTSMLNFENFYPMAQPYLDVPIVFRDTITDMQIDLPVVIWFMCYVSIKKLQ